MRVVIVLVREALEFTISSNTPLPVTATSDRLSKKPSKSSTVAEVGLPVGGFPPPPALPSAAPPNYSASFPPAWILMVSFMSALVYSLHHFAYNLESFSRSSKSPLALGKR